MSWSSSSLSRQRAQAASFIEDSVSSDRLDVTNRTRTAEQAQASLAVTIKVIHAVAVFRRLLRNRQQRLGLPSSPPSPPLTPLGAEQPACPAIEWDELKMGRLLGQGAFCSAYSVNLSKQRQHEVFAAYPVDQDPSFQTCCKLLLPKHRHCKLAIADLKREAVLLSHLCHVHVMGALCHGLTPQGDTFVVMPLLASTLTAALPRPMDEVGVLKHRAQVKAWPLVRAVRLAVQLGRALRYCHREAFPGCAVLHRDLKPDNVGLAPGGGDVILFDFGLAKITSPCEAGEPATQGGPKLTGQTGSLRYMAPEVALCEPYDERADVYSFAIILWQMAARTVPFAGMAAVGGIEGFIERVARQGARPPLPPKWPAALRQTLATCWEAEVPRRATICAALPALESLLVELELGATRPKSAGAARPSKGLAALFGRRASI